jgi:beta-galactosidase
VPGSNGSWERGTWPPPYILYGGDYSPEQWPPEVWREDVALMREAGVNLATVGVFAWARLEPSPGEFSFGWLGEVLDLLGGAGIGVCLATPTAAPPPWLSARHPEVLPVDARGVRYSHGSRQHFCVHSPAYRRSALRIVAELARELGGHPALRAWHVHNEYACHVPQCYCDTSAEAFRDWLRQRYGTVAALNDAWGTDFWSQRYRDFSEVLPPRVTPTYPNPSQELDYRRFWNDSYFEEFAAERDLLRAEAPSVPVTTNFMGFFKPLDYFTWAAGQDFCCSDNYADPADPDRVMLTAMHYDLIRSLKKGTAWTVMEQAVSRVNWRPVNSAKVPGQMRRDCYQALARGAAGLSFFQWRASAAGAEKFHSAMLPHAGTAAPSWREVTGLGAELPRLAEVNTATVTPDCAIVFSWPNWWALELPAKPSDEVQMLSQTRWLYRPLFEAGITADFARPDEDLSIYPLVIVPSLYLLTQAEGTNIRDYVERGGTAVISFWSGIVDEHDRVHPGPYGGPLRELFGGDVVDVVPLQPGETADVLWHDGRRTTASCWLDIIDPVAAKVLASYASTPWAGRPAVLENSFGSGRVIYLGTRLNDDALRALLGQVIGAAGGDRSPATGRGEAGAGAVHQDPGAMADEGPRVERVVRRAGPVSYEFLINHSGSPVRVPVAGCGHDLVSGAPVSGHVRLAAQDVAVIRRGASDMPGTAPGIMRGGWLR